MNQSFASAKIVLDTRKKAQTKKGLFPVKIQVVFQGQPRKYAPGKHFAKYHFSKEDFTKVMGQSPRGKHKEDRIYLEEHLVKARGIIASLEENFSFAEFKVLFKGKAVNPVTPKSLYDLFEIRIKELDKNKQFTSASLYKSTLSALKRFRKRLSWHDITPNFLDDFEQDFLNRGNSLTTVGIYMRNLRAIINRAIEEQLFLREKYPFGSNKYVIPTTRTRNIALNKEDLKKIFEYKATTQAEQHACDLWIFSYLCNGMNLKDIANLKWRDVNLSQSRMVFRRQKTKKTVEKVIEVILLGPALKIIEKWGNPDRSPQQFVFNLTDSGASSRKQHNDHKQRIKSVNKYLQRMGENLGIPDKITTYTARHSFATILKQSGASLEEINEMIGHGDVRITALYLGSLEDSQKRATQQKLIDL